MHPVPTTALKVSPMLDKHNDKLEVRSQLFFQSWGEVGNHTSSTCVGWGGNVVSIPQIKTYYLLCLPVPD